MLTGRITNHSFRRLIIVAVAGLVCLPNLAHQPEGQSEGMYIPGGSENGAFRDRDAHIDGSIPRSSAHCRVEKEEPERLQAVGDEYTRLGRVNTAASLNSGTDAAVTKHKLATGSAIATDVLLIPDGLDFVKRHDGLLDRDSAQTAQSQFASIDKPVRVSSRATMTGSLTPKLTQVKPNTGQ